MKYIQMSDAFRAAAVNIRPPLLFHNQWAKLVIAAKTTYKSSRPENPSEFYTTTYNKNFGGGKALSEINANITHLLARS